MVKSFTQIQNFGPNPRGHNTHTHTHTHTYANSSAIRYGCSQWCLLAKFGKFSLINRSVSVDINLVKQLAHFQPTLSLLGANLQHLLKVECA